MGQWQFRTLNPNDTSGTTTSEDNFAQEERTSAEIMVRECLQNPLDARNQNEHVEVRFRWVTLPASSTFAQAVLTSDFTQQLRLGKVISEAGLPKTVSLLLIEDFGTLGLVGTFEDSAAQGQGENWNAFWFREGEGAKPSKSNGGAGQGKLTMYVASGLRTVFAMTRRVDGERLFYGSCRFRSNYAIGKDRYAREARFGSTSDPNLLSLPVRNQDALDRYTKELSLLRDHRTGTSFIILAPSPEITPEAITAAVVNEFYFPILRGRLSVYVNDHKIATDTIQALALDLSSSLRLSPGMRSFIDEISSTHIDSADMLAFDEAWASDSKLRDDHAPQADTAALRELFSNGKLVSARFPIRVSSVRDGVLCGFIRVFVQGGDAVFETEELFVRQDLAIDKEKSLRSSKRLMPARALILVDDEVVSQYLAAAEEPTHREWNGSRPRLNERYRNVAKPLRLVRHAASRLVEFLSPSGIRDNVALSMFFPDFGSLEAGKGATADKKSTSGVTTVKTKVDPPKKRKLDVVPLTDGARVRVLQSNVGPEDFPLHCELELAYGTEFGNAFDQWDAADFFLSSGHIKEEASLAEVEFDGNVITFDILGPDATLLVGGFDMKRQLEIKLKYKDQPHASN